MWISWSPLSYEFTSSMNNKPQYKLIYDTGKSLILCTCEPVQK